MSERSEAIRRREGWALTAREQARLAAALTVGGVKVGRGKGAGRESAAAERVWSEAAARVEAEDAAQARIEAQARKEKAEKKATRRGWF